MKILHIQGFTKEERMDKLREIRENIFDSIKVSRFSQTKKPIEFLIVFDGFFPL